MLEMVTELINKYINERMNEYKNGILNSSIVQVFILSSPLAILKIRFEQETFLDIVANW